MSTHAFPLVMLEPMFAGGPSVLGALILVCALFGALHEAAELRRAAAVQAVIIGTLLAALAQSFDGLSAHHAALAFMIALPQGAVVALLAAALSFRRPLA